MNLHRNPGKAEWAATAPDKRNIWQKLAARTHGIATIGNVFSIVGLASVPVGLWEILGQGNFFLGIGILLAGRVCDVLDGWLADITHTKSPLGEKIDAIFDKISIGVTVLALAIGHMVSWLVLVVLLAPHLIVGILAIAAFIQNKVLHPTAEGKASMGVAWLAILALTAVQSFHFMVSQWTTVVVTAMVAYGLLFISVVLGVYSTYGYIEEFKRLQTKPKSARP